MSNKITIEDIIAKKDEIKKVKNKVIKLYIKSLGGYVELAMPDRKLIADSLNFDNGIESDIHLVSNSMISPDLKDKEAQKAFGVLTPKELLTEIFLDGEVGVMAGEIMKFAGYDNNAVKVLSDDIKK